MERGGHRPHQAPPLSPHPLPQGSGSVSGDWAVSAHCPITATTAQSLNGGLLRVILHGDSAGRTEPGGDC